ncbi:hypothetical protein QBC42DRAFT_327019 [Cladorrhinum samala]|uniref:Uncharacterized protein n=1 Tax=Cladorrhinum samala TaxID=585594 RepID=A0AAV9HRA4_9PEZI|nr:hypothetical protein QBC42DRAFT_327019 [Cladorrhinum samala]
MATTQSTSIPWKERYIRPFHGKPFSELSLEEKLWLHRDNVESQHRMTIYRQAVDHTYRPSVGEITTGESGGLPPISADEFRDTCNKSVPLYILPLGRPRLPLLQVLHNYIYRAWFRPWRSEVEHERFICKFIYPGGVEYQQGNPSPSTIDALAALNSAVCAEVESRRRYYAEQIAAHSGLEDKHDVDSHIMRRPLSSNIVENHKFHVLQPLFRALLIVVSPGLYDNQRSHTAGTLPVFLVRTGVEDGLSGPISFDTITADKGRIADFEFPDSWPRSGNVIKTDLEAAIDFVKALEEREARAFGLRPDPVAAWEAQCRQASGPPRVCRGEPIPGPSSCFIERPNFPVWEGEEAASGGEPTWMRMERFCAWREESGFEVMEAFEGEAWERAQKSKTRPYIVQLRSGRTLYL